MQRTHLTGVSPIPVAIHIHRIQLNEPRFPSKLRQDHFSSVNIFSFNESLVCDFSVKCKMCGLAHGTLKEELYGCYVECFAKKRMYGLTLVLASI